jgi:hypothetical protein
MADCVERLGSDLATAANQGRNAMQRGAEADRKEERTRIKTREADENTYHSLSEASGPAP